jgi:YHS domain-containing protein
MNFRIISAQAGNMMAAPAKRKACIRLAMLSTLLAGVLAGCWAGIFQLYAATTERVVTDYHTGLAISGFDPVGYFTNSKAMVGRADIETRYAGATWRFINEGNRAAFIDHPEVYLPVFGGYDPMGVARGVAVAGHPAVWLIAGERLYLFHNAQTREAFLAEPERFLELAKKTWPVVESTLVQ